MKVINVGRVDRSIFQSDSAEAIRIKNYGSIFEQFTVIAFFQGKQPTIQLAPNVVVIPTNSRFKILYPFDAYRIARKISADVVSAQDSFEAGMVGYWIKKYYSIPLQLQLHTDVLSPYFWKESFKNKLRVLCARFLIPRADGVRVVSERIKQSLVSQLNIPSSCVTVLPVFVDVEKVRAITITTDLHKKYPQFDFIILMASRVTKEKNIDIALHAMRSVIKKFPKTGLVIVGSGPEENKLKQSIYHSSLNHHVIFESWVGELASYYKTADCFVITSNYEGYGRTAIESLAAGCPVIMTNVGIAGDIVREGESGMITPVGDSHILAEALKMIIGDPNVRERLRMGGLKALDIMPSKDEYFAHYKNALEKLI